MAFFMIIFIALVILNVLLLVFSNSLRTSSVQVGAAEKANINSQRVYNLKAAGAELKKAV